MDPRTELTCLELSGATSNPKLNWATVGLPRHLSVEEARDKPVELAPSAQKQVLTIKQESESDFVVDALTIHLWLVGGGAPARTLTRVPADGAAASGTAAPVFIRFADTSGPARREMQTRNHHWANLAGNGRFPAWLGIPETIPAGTRYAIEVDNTHSTNTYAISVGLWGRYVSANYPPEHRGSGGQRRAIAGNPTRAWVGMQVEEMAARGYFERQQIQDSNVQNAHGAGVPRFYPLPGAPISPAVGNFDVPGAVTTTRIRVDSEYRFYCRHIMGQQLVSGQSEIDAEMARPMFVRVFDKRGENWLTNGFVPMDAIAGTGEYPFILPVDWVWGPHADISVELKSMDASLVGCDLTFEGFLVDRNTE